MENENTLELTANHFVPVFNKEINTEVDNYDSFVYKRAKDVVVGDVLLVSIEFYSNSHTDSKFSSSKYEIINKEVVTQRGLFNPYLLSGTILVNSVLVSCHSDWILDTILDLFGLTSHIPNVYQALLAPLRGMVKVLGVNLYKKLKISKYVSVMIRSECL